MKRAFLTLLLVILGGALIFGGCTAPAPAPAPTPTPTPTPAPAPKVVELKALNPFNYGQDWKDFLRTNYNDKVVQRAGGEIKINWVGGPEVIPGYQQVDAIRTGAIDMIMHLPPDYAEALFPAATTMALLKSDFAKEHQSGMYDLYVEGFQKFVNARYLGRSDGYSQYTIFLTKPISKLDDLKGIILRVTPLQESMCKALGISPVILPQPELYGALERKVVDGWVSLEFGAKDFGCLEVTKYIVHPRFYQGAACILVNLDKWNQLSKNAQDVMLKIFSDELQPQIIEYRKKQRETYSKIYTDAGIKFIQLPSADADKLVDTVYSTTWDYLIKKDSQYTPKFRELDTK